MIWFLRRFRAYRDLEAELAEAAARAIEADDRVRLMQAYRDAAEVERDRSRTEQLAALKSVANFEARRAGCAFMPYPDVEIQNITIPEMPVPTGLTPPPYRRSLRELQQDAVMKSRADAVNRRKALVNGDQED